MVDVEAAAGERAWPGRRLASAREVAGGEGTYAWGGGLHAALAGTVALSYSDGRYLVSVHLAAAAGGTSAAAALPAVGDVVTCRVLRMNTRIANLEILAVDGVPLREPASGLLRREDVRSFEKDKVAMYSSCRPGDVVQARVISLGDSRAYFVSTAEDELGVVLAQSAEDAATAMVPVSWEEIMCPLTHTREARKVAKPAGMAGDALEAAGGEGARPQ